MISKKDPMMISCYHHILSYKDRIARSDKVPIHSLNLKDLKSNENVYIPQYVSGPSTYMTFHKIINSNFSNHHQIYTDASKQLDKTSCAIYDPHLESAVKYRINGNFTIFSEELFAMWKALHYVSSLFERFESKNILILSDSQISLLSKLETKLNFIHNGILESLKYLRNLGLEVSFMWTRAHSGIPGNEKVNYLAKEALEIDEIDSSPCVYSDIIPFF
ncbi:hypothetical protein HHI36_015802 [Cryptolaemus montrouzieri]|uniref:RNase H type-1 domain-containing protein n=1 Tax=Cryptolaemus montrouzieri TaxID=559131 RepID=A0ABD2N6K5_9CUCU